MVYEPAEDSYLLERVVKEHAHGDVLDMGTGSGIQAQAATNSPKVSSVVAADIDEMAVAAASALGLNAVHSDLFSKFAFRFFDTIICNTPYLPNEQFADDIALDGGKKGFEWTLNFLEQARFHMRPKGQLLVLISTRTNPGVVEQKAIELGYEFTLIDQEKIAFETLLVYKFTRAFSDVDIAYLAKGKRSVVYEKNNVVYKKSDVMRAQHEAQFLQRVNALGIGPKLHFVHSDVVAMDKIEGTRLGDYWEHTRIEDAAKVLQLILAQLKLLDAHKIEKQELTNPYKHIIIKQDGSIVLIDWERARMREDPQNVRQFTEHIARTVKKYPHLQRLEELT